MNLFDSRYSRLFRRSETVADLTEQVADLRQTVESLAQEVATLDALLRLVWPGGEDNYRQQYRWNRIQAMLGRRTSAALYPFTLDDEDFLRERLQATEEEIAQFREMKQWTM